MEPDQQLRNLRDFLLVYNRMTEICFQRCTTNFNYRNITMDEERCVDSCAGKLIRANHRLMGSYVQLMPRMVQRRMEEMESKAAESAKAAEAAAAAASLGPPAAEASALSPSPAAPTLTPTPQIPAVSPAFATVDGPESHGSVSKPARLDLPVNLEAPGGKLSAAAPATPANEAVGFTARSNAESGLSNAAGFPQLPVAGAQTESGSPGPVFLPSNPTSLSENVPTSTVSLPSTQERAPPLSGK